MRRSASGQRPTPPFTRHDIGVVAVQCVAYGQQCNFTFIFVRFMSSDLTGFLLLAINHKPSSFDVVAAPIRLTVIFHNLFKNRRNNTRR